MSSTTSANLATAFKIKGASLSVSSACSTSAHCIELACDEIALGRHDIMFAGGGESADWTISCLFDAMGALSKDITILLRKHPDHMTLTEMVS